MSNDKENFVPKKKKKNLIFTNFKKISSSHRGFVYMEQVFFFLTNNYNYYLFMEVEEEEKENINQLFPCNWISKVLEVFLSHLKRIKRNLLQNFSNITLRSNFDDQKHLLAKVCVNGMKYDAQLIETHHSKKVHQVKC